MYTCVYTSYTLYKQYIIWIKPFKIQLVLYIYKASDNEKKESNYTIEW